MPQDFQNKITVLLPTCPIVSAPSTSVIDATFRGLRYQLPKVKVLLCCDGWDSRLQVSVSDYTACKNTMKERVAAGIWNNVEILEFDTHLHQAGMWKNVLDKKLIATPLVLHQEHDQPFTEGHIEWEEIVEILLRRDLTWVRFSPETTDFYANVLSKKTVNFGSTYIGGVRFEKTCEFSGTPSIGRLEFFEFLMTGFSPERRNWRGHIPTTETYLECFNTQSLTEWDQGKMYPMALYAPEGEIQRIKTIDGRENVPAFPKMTF